MWYVGLEVIQPVRGLQAHPTSKLLVFLLIQKIVQQPARGLYRATFQILDLAGRHAFDIWLELRILRRPANEEWNPGLRSCS